MTLRLRDALRKHVVLYRHAEYDGVRSPWVFHHLRTIRRAVAGHRITRLREELNKAAKRAKLPAEFVPHDLRHRRATTRIADEANVHHVQKAMGHSTIQMTMEYTDIADEYLKSLVNEPSQPASAAR